MPFALVALGALLVAIGGPKPARAADFADIYKEVKPSVVYVLIATATGAASGSGFIYDSDATHSIVVTAYHVVADAQRIDVVLDSDPAKRYPAKVLEHDRRLDIAFLDIPVPNRAPLRLAERAQIEEGNGVAAIGYPRVARMFQQLQGDDLRPSVHSGIVSAIRLGGEIVQVDAQTDHGDSGGPIVDVKTGRVVGIVLGALLDPSFVKAGLQKELPGSSYAASAMSIYAVRNKLVAGIRAPSETASPVAGISLTENMASLRVVFVTRPVDNPQAKAFLDPLVQRFRDYFTTKNLFYSIEGPTTAEPYPSTSSLLAYCDSFRSNVIIFPNFGFDPAAPHGTVSAGMSLIVTDCYGVPYYWRIKFKSEQRLPNRTIERELTDMTNDLIDQELAKFESYRNANKSAWDNLLKAGIALDPAAPKPPLMVGIWPQGNFSSTGPNVFRVLHLRPEGQGAKAGLKEGDVIVSIDGVPPAKDDQPFDVMLRLEAAQTVVVRRPATPDITITLRPAR
jgi:S1-C subfamily serine protease